jgi:1-acyl-sn-glycerol-3-phosphate acyltransferase
MYVVRSVITYLAISLYVLVAGTIGLLIAIPFKAKNLLYVLGHGGVWLALNLAGIRYTVVGREHVPADRAVVFCANHQSNVDPPVLFEALHKRLHILYKAELRKLPVLGRVFEVGGFVAVQRENRDAAFASIEQAAESIRRLRSWAAAPLCRRGVRLSARYIARSASANRSTPPGCLPTIAICSSSWCAGVFRISSGKVRSHHEPRARRVQPSTSER